jgi:hypothetical protein
MNFAKRYIVDIQVRRFFVIQTLLQGKGKLQQVAGLTFQYYKTQASFARYHQGIWPSGIVSIQ